MKKQFILILATILVFGIARGNTQCVPGCVPCPQGCCANLPSVQKCQGLHSYPCPYHDKYTKAQNVPNFRLKSGKEYNATHVIEARFPDGYIDEIVFEIHNVFSNQTEEEEKCNFLGHFLKNPSDVVSITGCIGSVMEMTITGKYSGYYLYFEGNTYKLEDLVRLPSVFEEIQTSNEKEFIIPERFENKALPSAMNVLVRPHLDQAVLDLFPSENCMQEYIKAVVIHAQAVFLHPSLGTKIHLKLADTSYWKIYKGQYHSTSSFKRIQVPTNDGINFNAFFCGKCIRGMAYWYGKVCTPGQNSASIPLYKYPAVWTGFNFAHEFGHLLGMYHDFERTRVYNQRLSHLQAGCDHKGIMSYTLNGKLAPAQWTHCSQQDFTHVYNWNVFKRKWCL